MREYCQTGVFGWFVWCRNPSKFLDDSGLGFGVKAFLIAFGTGLWRAVNIDLQKLSIVKEGPEFLAIFAIRRNECCEDDDTSVHEEFYHFADTADVLCPVFRPEGQVSAKPVSDIVSVESISRAALLMQFLFNKVCNG
jgi:hypothetical protein